MFFLARICSLALIAVKLVGCDPNPQLTHNPFIKGTEVAQAGSSAQGVQQPSATEIPTERPVPTVTPTVEPVISPLIPMEPAQVDRLMQSYAPSDSIDQYEVVAGIKFGYAEGVSERIDSAAVEQYIGWLLKSRTEVTRLSGIPVALEEGIPHAIVLVGHDMPGVAHKSGPGNTTFGITYVLEEGSAFSFSLVNSATGNGELGLAVEICQNIYNVNNHNDAQQEAVCNTMGRMHDAVMHGLFPNCLDEHLYNELNGNEVRCVGQIYGMHEFPTRALFM